MRSLELRAMSSSQEALLKYLALFLMTIDHIGGIFFNGYVEPNAATILGRLVFPIFAFLAAYNYLYNTSDKKKYIFRLLTFAFISQVPYMLAFGGIHERFNLNVLFTLGLSLGYIYIGETYVLKLKKKIDALMANLLLTLVFLIFFLAVGDFTIFGFLVVLRFYLILKKPTWFSLFFLLLFSGMLNMGASYWFMVVSALAIPFIYMFTYINIEFKRVINGKWFYVYYPLHLLILWLFSMSVQ